MGDPVLRVCNFPTSKNRKGSNLLLANSSDDAHTISKRLTLRVKS
jgi:hypothetical protein